MRLRAIREAAGLSQSQLARRAGVSRQLVGAVEAGRHLPRVDAALALAGVLGADVAELFSSAAPVVDVLTGLAPADGTLVRSGVVGEQSVTLLAGADRLGWDAADAVVTGGALDRLAHPEPGVVVAGCEPALVVLERILREAGMGALAASTSSAGARVALAGGRLHAAVVHGPRPEPDAEDGDIVRLRLARWRVGLAAPAEFAGEWWRRALSGTGPVVQREPEAGVQRTFESCLAGDAANVVPGPRVGSHFEAARRAVIAGLPAVTIEPAALAFGASFHPLDSHVAELWIDAAWQHERSVAAAVDVLSSPRFRKRLLAVGGYDLAGCGDAVA